LESFKIVGLCIIVAIAYGISQDLITTRVCVEYFTIGHPPVWGGVADPTLLALTWGVLATWWVGLFLGVGAALAARIGKRPRASWRDLLKPVLILMATVGMAASAAGLITFLGTSDDDRFPGFPPEVPQHRRRLFAVDLAAHNAAYLVGFVGGVVCCALIWWKRGASERQTRRDALIRHKQRIEDSLPGRIYDGIVRPISKKKQAPFE
jgi:hypothetical protein